MNVSIVFCVQNVFATEQISNVFLIVRIKNAVHIIVQTNLTIYINAYWDNDCITVLCLPISPNYYTVIPKLLML